MESSYSKLSKGLITGDGGDLFSLSGNAIIILGPHQSNGVVPSTTRKSALLSLNWSTLPS
jgi:hypothetical protein